ncbi:phosphatase PAP2 family protein [Leptospira wolffii]|uniref:Acid phosphatase n=1 Tax=Leptospira wolffii TaxID=409998 RepID=A0A2M9ZBA8_9LEPT|nr:phosphatase PAP2 family protein [Leptospira wolffii]PJZ65726.1 acid phosphatase [Leptospira wolffii]TGK56055.1 phosphatase PAP2 family protein [Leptospira wolffii]TGK72101.1 phosphatase PAP2 family protein [Leptospira wolffii]TGK73766.1 phosphatase PAP2 family protein [Leptospira wolffii]TGL27678.1 phosphatase PAP2 family protein [Leptospira wolffii]
MTWAQTLHAEILFSNSPLEALHIPFLKALLDPLSVLFHYLGSTLFFMAIVSFVYICVDRRLGIRIALALLVAGILNGTCKALLAYPRPIGLPYPSELGLMEGSYGLPSGHVQTAVALYGTIFLHARRVWVRWVTAFLILFMPIARMYAGLHFLGDVIGGALLGLLVLLGLELLLRKFPFILDPGPTPELFSDEKRFKSYILAIIAVTIPSVLLQESGQPESTAKSWEQVISASGALAGFGISILLNQKAGRDWSRASGFAEFAARLGIVILGILVFYLLLGKILAWIAPENPVARYFRYGIVCFYIGYLSPFLLKRIRGGTYLQ